jgi:hypothetical protein
MKSQFVWEPEVNAAGRQGNGFGQQGMWFQQGDRIVVILDEFPLSEQELGEAPDDSTAIHQAIANGTRDENQLTDAIFNARHPERRGQHLQVNERQLIREWLDIRDNIVRPALRVSSAGVAPAAPANAQAAAQAPSTTSGVEAAENTTRILQCILGLQDQGRAISFVQRYLRNLTRAEATALSNAGLQIVSCYEYGDPTKMAYFTRAQGLRDGRLGFTQAQAVGQTSGTPIYFAVDTDPDVTQRQAILDYFQGIQEGYAQYVLDMQGQNRTATPYAVGVYGSGCVLDWCRTQGIATWFWQAFAPGWCNNRRVWGGANIHTSGRDEPKRCGWRLGRLEGWGNEGGWTLQTAQQPELRFMDLL